MIVAEDWADADVVWAPQPGPQTSLLECPVKMVFFGGARGGGKSDALLGKGLQHLETWGEHANIIFFRRTLTELEELIERAKQIYIPLGAIWKEQAKLFVWPEHKGVRMRFRYLESVDDASRYQGRSLTFIGIDEAGNYPTKEPIMRLFGAMRSAHGVTTQMVLTGNPGGPGHDWLKEMFVDPAEPGVIMTDRLPNKRLFKRVFIPSKITDNKILLEEDPDYISNLYMVGDAWLVEAWLEGNWDARPFGEYFFTSKIVYAPAPPMNRVYLGVDTATKKTHFKDRNWKERDPSAYCVWGVDHRKRHWVLDCKAKRMPNNVLMEIIFRLHKFWGFTNIFIENGPIWAAMESFVHERMKATGVWLPIVGCTPVADKTTRALQLSTIVNNGALYMEPGNKDWQKDFLGEMAVFPTEGTHDDRVDAAAWCARKVTAMLASDDPNATHMVGRGHAGRKRVEREGQDREAAAFQANLREQMRLQELEDRRRMADGEDLFA